MRRIDFIIKLLLLTVILLYSCKSDDGQDYKEVELINENFDKYFIAQNFNAALSVSNTQIKIDSTNPLGYFNKALLLMTFKELEEDSAIIYFNHSIILVDKYERNSRYFSIRADAKVYLNALDKSIDTNRIPVIDSVIINYKNIKNGIN